MRSIGLHASCVVAVLLLFDLNVHADDVADRAAIERAATEWTLAFNSRDISRLLRVATTGVVLLQADAPPSAAPAAVRETLGAVFAHDLRIINQTKEILVAGDVAWRVAALTIAQPGAPMLRSSALEIWQRSESGAWQLHRQISAGLLTRKRAPPRTPRPHLDSSQQ